MGKRTILIDLDGVLNTYTGSYDEKFIPPLKDGADVFLEKLAEKFDLKLFTTRSKVLVEKWCKDNDIMHYFSEITNVKKMAWLIIDDRCIKFDGNYQLMLSKIFEFKPWYKS